MSHSRRTAPLTLEVVLVLVLVLAAILAGCVAAAPSGPTGSPGSIQPTGFYLRAWTSQPVSPASAFGDPARLVISDSRLYDTAVAVPAIYPGPLLVEPFVRSIAAAGISRVEDAVRAQGLLVSRDFTAATPSPGALVAHLEVVVGGVWYTLSGDPSRLLRCGSGTRCVADPGTGEAFAAFWQQLTGDLEAWLGPDLGSASSYSPERLGVLAVPPVESGAGPIEPTIATWSLQPFASFGTSYAGGRCGTVTGSDLTNLLPLLRASNQLTRFRDSAGDVRSLVLRVLLPGEKDACVGSSAGSPTSPGAPSSGSSVVPLPSPTLPSASGGPTSSAAASAGTGSGNGLGVPTVLGLACFGGGDLFSPAALTGPATAETAADPPALALRALLATAGRESSWLLPQKGWRRVAESATAVLFLAQTSSDPPYSYVSVVPVAGSTEWKAAGWGQCRPMAKLAPPFGPTTWQLEATPSPAATTFTALVSEMACASGEPAAGRTSDPLIVYGVKTVTVTFGVVPLEGIQTCPGPPPSPVVVHLREPLGDRQLVDGAVYPPKPVEVVNPT